MTADVDLLPPPEPHWIGMDTCDAPGPRHYTADQMHAYARANVAHATAPLQAEIEALRAEVDMLRGKVDEAVVELLCRKARAERLAEALRLALDSHGKTLLTDPPQDAWKVNRVEEIGRALLREQEEGQ